MVVAAYRERFEEAAKERQREGGRTAGRSRPMEKIQATLPEPIKDEESTGHQARDDMADAAGVSPRTMQKALNVQASGDEQLVDDVREGRLSVNAAAKTLSTASTSTPVPPPIGKLVQRLGVNVDDGRVKSTTTVLGVRSARLPS